MSFLITQGPLGFAERYPGHFDAMIAGSVQPQCAPSAADIEQTLPRCEPQLGANVTQLLLLRDVEIVIGIFEIGARIQHLAIEPNCKEFVAEIIVMGNVAPRSGCRVASPPRPESGDAALP